MSHANVAIFVPHNGCPNQCSFCNQKNITGVTHQPSPGEVEDILKNVKNNNKDMQIAFFGGSFTAIDQSYMINLLKVASNYVKKGHFSGIRISTRPDAINDNILNILEKYNVTDIELGAQSMNDDVLRANHRGHTREDIISASNLIKSRGFSLGLQMMTGLYKSNYNIDYQTGIDILNIRPDTIRIYPTVILKGTQLETLYKTGYYNTLSFDKTVDLCCKLLSLFESNNIPVIRLGLHFSESLCSNMVGGVFHPAFREICESRILLYKIQSLIKERNINPGVLRVKVQPKYISKLVGHNKSNIKKLKDARYILKIEQDSSIKGNILI